MYSRIPYLSGYPYCHNICGVEVTLIKITSHEDWTILGIYRSPKVPVRQLCEVISEVLNSISQDNIIIVAIKLGTSTSTGSVKHREDLYIM